MAGKLVSGLNGNIIAECNFHVLRVIAFTALSLVSLLNKLADKLVKILVLGLIHIHDILIMNTTAHNVFYNIFI